MEERGRLQQKLLDEEEGAGAGGKVGSEGKAVEEVQEDPLDAFMSNVTVQLEQSKVSDGVGSFFLPFGGAMTEGGGR
jgi:hypothetical protein